MNLAQIRTLVLDTLTAGGGQNTDVSVDPFWTVGEVNNYINKGQRELSKVINRARKDYFTRILRTTDATLSIMGQTFTPSTLSWAAGSDGNFVLPADFVKMKLITDLSQDRVRIIASDIAKHEFRILMNDPGSATSREYLYDIIGVKTLIIRPRPNEAREMEFIYIKRLPSLIDYEFNITVSQGATLVTFGATVTDMVVPGMEIIEGATNVTNATPDPSAEYPVIKSVDSPTTATLEGPWPNADRTNWKARLSPVSEIPIQHHDVLAAFAIREGFMKGTNPHEKSILVWQAEYRHLLQQMVDDVEIRGGSDQESVEAYLEDIYGA